ncbi:unnamed protein product, partial [Tilletia controversa]
CSTLSATTVGLDPVSLTPLVPSAPAASETNSPWLRKTRRLVLLDGVDLKTAADLIHNPGPVLAQAEPGSIDLGSFDPSEIHAGIVEAVRRLIQNAGEDMAKFASDDILVKLHCEDLDYVGGKQPRKPFSAGPTYVKQCAGFIGQVVVKPHNFLLYPNHVCKVTDFGLSRPKDNSRLVSPTETLGYRPPEKLFNTHVAHQFDRLRRSTWSLGQDLTF